MKNLYRESFTLNESQCSVVADKPEGIDAAKESIKRNRLQLEAYIKTNPNFFHTLEPVSVPNEPLVAKWRKPQKKQVWDPWQPSPAFWQI